VGDTDTYETEPVLRPQAHILFIDANQNRRQKVLNRWVLRLRKWLDILKFVVNFQHSITQNAIHLAGKSIIELLNIFTQKPKIVS